MVFKKFPIYLPFDTSSMAGLHTDVQDRMGPLHHHKKKHQKQMGQQTSSHSSCSSAIKYTVQQNIYNDKTYRRWARPQGNSSKSRKDWNEHFVHLFYQNSLSQKSERKLLILVVMKHIIVHMANHPPP